MNDKVVEMTRHPISITLPEQCIKWLDEQVESRRYHNRSHAVEVFILEKMKGERKE